MQRLLLAFGPALLLSACSFATEEVRIRSNATWAPDGSAILVVETRYNTSDPAAPHYFSPNATNWRTVFLQAKPDLLDTSELASFDEFENNRETQGGGAQAAPLYWLKDQQKVVGLMNHEAVAFDLGSGKLLRYTLPRQKAIELFTHQGHDMSEGHSPLGVIPSPDASKVAVFHSVAYEGTDWTDLRFVHAIAIHRLDGTFERAVSTNQWKGIDRNLLTPLPKPSPLPPSPEAGTANWVRSWVPVHTNSPLFWSQDSQKIYVVYDYSQNDLPRSSGWEITIADGRVEGATELPERLLPTIGGGVSPSGELLTVYQNYDKPNEDKLELFQLDNWIPFEELKMVEVDQIGF